MGTISPVTDLSSDPCHWIYFEISKTICWNLLYDQQPILDNSTHQTFEVSPLGDVEQILDPVGCLALAAARALHRPHLLPPALPPVPGLGVRAPHRAVQLTGAPPEPARELLHGGGPRHAHPAAVHPAGGGARGGAGPGVGGSDIWLMLMLVARKLELTAARGPEAGLEEESERLPEAAEAAAWEAGLGRGRAESLATWVILARSPWLLASSLIVSMMETVCTWPLPPFILILALVSSN